MTTTFHHRRSIRLSGYDYTATGAYFVTICTYQRDAIFGEVVKEEMRLNEIGRIVEEEWYKTAEIRKEIALDEFVIMPNHFHGIVWIVGAHGNAPPAANAAPMSRKGSSPDGNVPTAFRNVTNPDGNISPIVGMDSCYRSSGGAHHDRSDGAHYHAPLHRRPRSLSTWVTGFKGGTARRVCKENPLFGPIWQRNYYEHVIRNDASLHEIRKYIMENPANWDSDPEHHP